MPIYEYQCTKCGHQFEELVRPDTGGKPRCPQCDSRSVERLLSVFAWRTAGTPEAAPRGPCVRCGDPDGPCHL